MRVAVGEAAWRLDLAPDTSPARARAALAAVPGVIDVVVAERHVLVTFDPAAPPDGVEQTLASVAGSAADDGSGVDHVIRVRYDGPDLAWVAEQSRLAVAEVVRRHVEREYTVRVVGFLPGFAYLGEVDPALVAPRLSSPRARVAPLSVGVAGARTGVYPCASPGGWNLIGTALDFVAFHPERGAALRLGDRVRFEQA